MDDLCLLFLVLRFRISSKILWKFQWRIDVTFSNFSKFCAVIQALAIFLHPRIYWWAWLTPSNMALIMFWLWSLYMNKIAFFYRLFYFCHLTFNEIICKSWIMGTTILIFEHFFLLFLQARKRVFKEIIFQITWEVNLLIFRLVIFNIKIFHQPIHIGIDLIRLSSNTRWVKDRYFILLVFVFILYTRMMIWSLYGLITNNFIKIDTFRPVNLPQNR